MAESSSRSVGEINQPDPGMDIPDMGIVVSGISGRFPMADNMVELEHNLTHGVDMVSDPDNTRWPLGLWDLPRRAGRIKDLSRFDYEFFNYEKNAANFTDSQLRILYEAIYESIIDSGTNPASLRGSKTGVFFGIFSTEFDYWLADHPSFKCDGLNYQMAIKVAQYFDFRGPVAAYDNACAAGFSALHEAVTNISLGIVDSAIVISSNLPLHPGYNSRFAKLTMLSPNGYCHFLDSKANGYVKGEAVVALFLQKKHVAKRNYVTILATLTNADGYKQEGITYPSAKIQEVLIRETKEKAGIHSNHVEYIEAHGTGTKVGDPIEIEAIAKVYCPSSLDDTNNDRTIGPLLVGSIKTNIGHCEGASGLCSLAKIILMLENETIYKSLHFSQPNPNIDLLIEGRIAAVSSNRKLLSKIIPISCYGFGGANAHGIFRANSRDVVKRFENSNSNLWHINEQWRLVLMFGRTEQSVLSFFDSIMSDNLNDKTLTRDFLALIDLLNSDSIDRLMSFRGYLLVDMKTQKEIHRSVAQCKLQQPNANTLSSTVCDLGRPQTHFQDHQQIPCYFFYAGLGCEWRGMGKSFKDFPMFWSTIERLQLILEPYGFDLTQILSMEQETNSAGKQYEQFDMLIGITAIQIALTNILKSCINVLPTGGIIGHSLGEIACAYAAEIYDERETILLTYHLADFMRQNQNQIEGLMVAFNLSSIETQELIDDYKNTIEDQTTMSTLYVACDNGPSSSTVSGKRTHIEKFLEFVKQKRQNETNKILYKILDFKCAVHNPILMHDSMKESLVNALQQTFDTDKDYTRNENRWTSTIYDRGQNIETIIKLANAQYYANELCERVDLYRVINRIPSGSVVIEIGPCGAFESVFKTLTPAKNNELTYVKLMKRRDLDGVTTLFKSIGQLYQAGIGVNLTSEKLYPSVEFPVRRQTPSISSLLKWNHSEPLFVPKYPDEFNKSSVSNVIEITIDVTQDKYKYLCGHMIDGRNLFPATGYLFYIWTLFSGMCKNGKNYDSNSFSQDEDNDDISKLRNLVPVEFLNVVLHRAVLLKENNLTKLRMNLQADTGMFEIKEGESVTCSGIVRSPLTKPDGLLYEEFAESMKYNNEDTTLTTLSSDDIYKQFRVNGYDYGETFKCVHFSSIDGQFVEVKFNGHLVALTDNILQASFLSMFAQHKAQQSGCLFLPSGFDYIRLNPDLLTRKLARHNRSKDEGLSRYDVDIFEDSSIYLKTYCDSTTGTVIALDGVEIRGIKKSLVQRREYKEPLVEKYQFVPDIEESVQDNELSKNYSRENYLAVCGNMFYELIRTIDSSIEVTLLNHKPSTLYNHLVNGYKSMDRQQLYAYMNKRLAVCRSKLSHDMKHLSPLDATYVDTLDSIKEQYMSQEELVKNRSVSLLSLLDSIQFCYEIESQRLLPLDSRISAMKLLQTIMDQLIEEQKKLIPSDILQSSFTEERFMKPVIETIIENSSNRHELRLLSIDTCTTLCKRIEELATNYSLNTSIEITLGHTDPVIKSIITDDEQSSSSSMLVTSINGEDFSADAAFYCDSSCFTPMIDIEASNFKHALISTTRLIKDNGFLVVMLRNQISMAERFIMAVRQINFDQYRLQSASKLLDLDIVERVNQISLNCETKGKILRNELEQNCHMQLVAKKTDTTGCKILVFRKSLDRKAIVDNPLIHIRHNNYCKWLEELQSYCNNVNSNEFDSDKPVWLCAVATKDNPMNGIVGFVQCLLQEFPNKRNFRCFYDCHTFKNQFGSEVNIETIKLSTNFRLASERDLFWNCIDSNGRWGSFRHFTIEEFVSQLKKLDEDNLVTNEIKTNQVYANVSTRGDLSSFRWYQAPFSYLSDIETKQLVQVNYSALNFKDIMLATGKLSLDTLPASLATRDCLLGLEFSGVDMHRKKRVAGMVVGGAIATYVLCPLQTSIKFDIPDNLSMKDAATIPVVYTTAIMALIYRGKIRSGESILIHAGSGGVGQAAIRLALYHGLKVFTTVGSVDKRQFLLKEFGGSLTSDQIFNSRDCSFETQVMEATNGRGVDLVLNSLADDKLQATIRCLANNGRFLEIGKYDLANDTKLELSLLDINKSFHGIFIDKLFEPESVAPSFNRQLKCVIDTLEDGLKKGYIKPIKQTCFPKDQIEQAFRYMATGKHIGKVLIEISAEQPEDMSTIPRQLIRAKPRFQLDPTRSYIVTGGLGGFGLELCKWLVSHGARSLIITSRSRVRTGYQRATLERLENNDNCKILIVDNSMADGTTQAGVEKLFELAKEQSTVNRSAGGLFHLACILSDKLLDNMTETDFELVCKPKADSCILLDKISRKVAPDMPLFVVFSSISCGKGNIGQTNYGYANSVMERVCEQRRQENLHGLAIQWGVIGDVGIAHENFGANDAKINGMIPQRMPSCLSTLSKLLYSNSAVCSSTLLAEITTTNNGGDAIASVTLLDMILRVLGIKDISKVEKQTNIGELGLDSLMSVEVSQLLERHCELKLNAQEIRSLTIVKIKELDKHKSKSSTS